MRTQEDMLEGSMAHMPAAKFNQVYPEIHPRDEEASSSEEEEEEEPSVGICDLFRYANTTDWVLIVIGSVCAGATGVAMPAFALLWGNMTDSFDDANQMVSAAKKVMLQFIYIGLGTFVAGWGMFACWMITGERQGVACRKEYLKSLLRQEIGWFDTINQSELSTKFATDCFAFQGAIGEKMSSIIMTIGMFVSGCIIALYYGWVMALVIIACLPFIAVGGAIYGGTIESKEKDQEKEYAEAGGLAQQSFSSIKTVKQLNGEQFEADNYAEVLKRVTSKSLKYGLFMGIGIGLLFGAMLFSYALGFWFGSHCVEGSHRCPPGLNPGDNKYTAGDTLIVFFCILMAGFNFTQLTPAIKKITEGKIAAARIFTIIDRNPLIQSPQNPIKPDNFQGIFKFEGVTFAYPKDKSKKILNNFTIEINRRTVAFVGESGCGKSTIFQLMMRFYDPDEGRITLDGVDLKDLDLYWLRTVIGYVGQEPVLFAMTLKENLLFGKEDATDDEIDWALKQAEAYEFVNNLKDRLDTFAGTAGGQISGGQKQRIAIARALLKNPKVLLLDEATSALDRRNQRLIQSTLNKISEDKISITIAHRVKTIMNSEEIIVLDRGEVAEIGQFHELKRYREYKKELETEEEIISPVKEPETVKQVPKQEKKAQKQGTGNPEARQGEEDEELSEEDLKKKEQQQLVEKYQDQIWGRLFAYCSHRCCLFIVGIIAAVLNGFIFPIFSIFIAKMIGVLLNFESDVGKARDQANLYALIFFLMGIAAFIINVIQFGVMSLVGEEMTERVRNEVYLKILKMPIPWFDKPKNSSGSLSARLAADCNSVNGLTTTYIAINIQMLSTLLSGIGIAFYYEWRTSLVALGLLPLIMIAGLVEMEFTNGFSAKTDKAYKTSSNLISETMLNIRTVNSFGYEDMIQRKYSEKLDEPLSLGVNKGMVAGLLFGLSQLILFVTFGLMYYLGSIFVRDNNLSVSDMFVALFAIVFAGMTAGNNAHFMPDVGEAKNAAANLFEILDGTDEDQLQVQQESKMLKTPIKGHFQFKNVQFKYESRDEKLFNGLNLEVREGWKVGFVGPSGCGKSTVQQMIQRFYEPESGQILIDGVDIKDYDIHHLRASLGVVSQEPVLFNETIGFNIKYNREELTHEEVVTAANESNFNPQIEKIEEVQQVEPKKKKKKRTEQEEEQEDVPRKKDGKGFDKNVGVKGSHISGGQKQRVAIARVIARQPKVLLLDQATSALDRDNEKKVQDSLDRMMRDKTSMSVAHRLETIQNSDKIMVFERGSIVEQGTFDELMSMRGQFYRLEKGLEML